MNERRLSARIVESLPFKIGHGRYDIEARTVNIGINGALCLADKSIPAMTQLKVGLTLPGNPKAKLKERVINTKGVVVRNEPQPAAGKFLIAIFFSELSPRDQKALEAFIQNRLKI